MPFYIYGLADPDGFVRYIGQTDNLHRRFRRHIQPSNLRATTHKVHWIKKLLRDGHMPLMVELECVCTQDEANDREIHYIAYYRALIGEALTNTTSGGDGVPNYKFTDEVRNKISESMRGNTNALGNVLSDATRKRMSEAHRGQRHTEETKAKMRGNTNSLGVRPSEETRKLLSDIRRGRKHSAETRAKMAESQRRRCERRRIDNLASGA